MKSRLCRLKSRLCGLESRLCELESIGLGLHRGFWGLFEVSVKHWEHFSFDHILIGGTWVHLGRLLHKLRTWLPVLLITGWVYLLLVTLGVIGVVRLLDVWSLLGLLKIFSIILSSSVIRSSQDLLNSHGVELLSGNSSARVRLLFYRASLVSWLWVVVIGLELGLDSEIGDVLLCRIERIVVLWVVVEVVLLDSWFRDDILIIGKHATIHVYIGEATLVKAFHWMDLRYWWLITRHSWLVLFSWLCTSWFWQRLLITSSLLYRWSLGLYLFAGCITIWQSYCRRLRFHIFFLNLI